MFGDVSCCMGCGCPLRESCRRYDPVAQLCFVNPLWWVEPGYDSRTGRCDNFLKR